MGFYIDKYVLHNAAAYSVVHEEFVREADT